MWKSKALIEADYDAERRTLRVEFRNGGRYEYLDVDPEVFEGLTHSAHPWTEWRERILQHDWRRLDWADAHDRPAGGAGRSWRELFGRDPDQL